MDDYDPRRLPAFQNKTLRLSAEEIKALALVDPSLSEAELAEFSEIVEENDQSEQEPQA